MKRVAALYLFSIIAVGAAILGILKLGSGLAPPASLLQAGGLHDSLKNAGAPVASNPISELMVNFEHPLSRLFLQLLVILVVSRIMGHLFVRFRQPAVVGEMAAGILLGPSLFGLLAPGSFEFVFSADSLGALRLLSQIGVCLFLFIVGMELNLAHIRARTPVAVAVSHVSILLPYLLGVLLAYGLYGDFAAPGATFTAFALFMGISMSITAFPVLVRILQEHGLARTPLGNIAVTSAAIDDVSAWTILAFVVAVARAASLGGAVLSLVLVLLFIAIMMGPVRAALPRLLGSRGSGDSDPSPTVLTAIVCLIVAAALATEVIGIHALFGAFLAGVVMPNNQEFRERIRLRFESFGSVLLLPLFFVFTGLRTEIGFIDDAGSWLVCALIIVVAMIGKLGGGAIAARVAGLGWRESLQLGTLMNTRGLMELIALNIGYDLGILSESIFAMLVIMALVTTMLTGPILGVLRR
ncbi:MAG: cation:proton antiporter [Nevskiaceae bacterium]|nr:cation:proton antiporter [Nevskiaceae bacterium]